MKGSTAICSSGEAAACFSKQIAGKNYLIIPEKPSSAAGLECDNALRSRLAWIGHHRLVVGLGFFFGSLAPSVGTESCEDPAVGKEMSKARGPPRRPQRATTTGQGTEGVSGGSYLPQSRGYHSIAAQQASATPSGSGTLQYPPLPAGSLMPTISRPPPLPPLPPPTTTITTTSNRGALPAARSMQWDTSTEGEAPPPSAPAPALAGDEAATLADYPYSIYNHGTWTADDDTTLIQARTGGQNWADLQRTHFPSKTSNACRKRYERLVERRGIHDHGGRRVEMVASEYMNMRRETWSGLADRVGMRWEVVEALVRIPRVGRGGCSGEVAC